MAATDTRATRRESDRRSGPRRAEEIAVHYAEASLLAAALAAADAWEASDDPDDALGRLIDIAADYRAKVAAAGLSPVLFDHAEPLPLADDSPVEPLA